MTLPPQKENYRPDIDGLRAIAILAVVVFHAFPAVAKGGFVGVDVFFVISGYLISRIVFSGLQSGNFSFASFYVHRIKRIFPALILVLLASFVFGWFVLSPEEYAQLGKHIAAGAGFVQNIALWREAGYFDKSSELKPLMHLWSLAIEEQFYLLYPLVIWLSWRARLKTFWVLVSLGILSFALNVGRIGAHPTEVFFLSYTRFWELLSGGLLAYISVFRTQKIAGPEALIRNQFLIDGAAALGLGFVIYAVFGLSRAAVFPGWWALLPVAGAWLLIFAGPQSWVSRRLLSNRALVFVGLISYPLYLWHWPILSFLKLLEGSPSGGQRLGAVALSFLLAWLTFRLVERPIRLGARVPAKVIVLTTSLVSTACLGFYSYAQQGLDSRFPEVIRSVASFHYDPNLGGARVGSCWLANEDAANGFSPDCLGKLADSHNQNAVVIWGDSHAARLFTGFSGSAIEGVAQFTRSSCPPTLGYAYANCVRSNEYVISQVAKYRPETVILFAVWDRYVGRWTKGTEQANGLLETLRQLKASGIKNVVVMGPAPNWSENLPKLVLKAWLRGAREEVTPKRMNIGLEESAKSVDDDLRSLVKDEGSATYFSVLDALCNNDGCLVRATEEPTSFTTWDYGHLTKDGAQFVVRQLPIYTTRRRSYLPLGLTAGPSRNVMESSSRP